MRRASIIIVAVMISIGALPAAYAQQSSGAGSKRPTVFAPDDENRGFQDAVLPSDAVLDALLSTEEAKNASEDFNSLDREGKRKCFSVVRIDLASEKDESYIANGNCAGLNGANNFWLWIVHVAQGKARILLFTNGLTVTIQPHMTNGYRDIKEAWGGNTGWGTRTYRYNGSEYKLAQKSWHDRKP